VSTTTERARARERDREREFSRIVLCIARSWWGGGKGGGSCEGLTVIFKPEAESFSL
jgi:hypothetical protein